MGETKEIENNQPAIRHRWMILNLPNQAILFRWHPLYSEEPKDKIQTSMILV